MKVKFDRIGYPLYCDAGPHEGGMDEGFRQEQPSSPAGGRPFSARDSASTLCSGQADRLARVRFLTLPDSR
jgi:hypothetical protein